MIFVQMIYGKSWKLLARFFMLLVSAIIPVCVLFFLMLIVHLLLEHQRLRDEEGKKLGLKAAEKSSTSKDNDVKMSDAEVSD